MCDCENCEKSIKFEIIQIVKAQERIFIKRKDTFERIFVWAYGKMTSDNKTEIGVYPLIALDGFRLELPCMFDYYDIQECFGDDEDFDMNLSYNSYKPKN